MATEPGGARAASAVHRVVIAGASVGGCHAAEQLRALGFAGRITLVGAESHLPYDRPPLSKQVLLGTRSPSEVELLSAAQLDGLGIEVRLGSAATGWNGRDLALADGSSVSADRLIVATGVRPRALPGQPEHPAVGTLRTVDDAEWLAGRLRRGGTLAVVGGGFIGAEVASAARTLGCDVVVLEATVLPMQRVLGADAALLLREVLDAAGVDFRGGVTVQAIEPRADAVTIRLSTVTGSASVRADTVVVGIGSQPQCSWLGVDDPQGIHCDDRGRALAVPNAYAIGDVAAWPDGATGTTVRTEHWTNARTQAAAVAADIVGAAAPADGPHYFWTDQFGLKIQVVGRPELADATHVTRPPDGNVKKSVVLYLRDDVVVGVALFSAARHLTSAVDVVRFGLHREAALEALALAVPSADLVREPGEPTVGTRAAAP
ncbi:NAD(P)/FAD-dependent oxidoreductase [uncultured Jatrophihabitans sp.]|uniref:NAD(P)/FAD-dependent oxidoreductase n=1 Tax=uncultured Jatrophihabitans sp. TaxID=1610747 RepID=UPI0035CAF3C9